MDENLAFIPLVVRNNGIHNPKTIIAVGALQLPYQSIAVVAHDQFFKQAMRDPGDENDDLRSILFAKTFQQYVADTE
ncbi:hypothetical protein ASD03_18495 [Ensifer sp. Root127]|nr:hypothetical protein ASD03_18495 [Ensifer sp. Root127]